MTDKTTQPLDRDAIRAVFMKHGFTIKEGQTDLTPYVYAAAEELIELARSAQPRTTIVQQAEATPCGGCVGTGSDLDEMGETCGECSGSGRVIAPTSGTTESASERRKCRYCDSTTNSDNPEEVCPGCADRAPSPSREAERRTEMSICPNTGHACRCQPQEGVMCQYGPTPDDWRTAKLNAECLPPLPLDPLCRDDTEHGIDYYTADQVRQAQRDAIALSYALVQGDRCTYCGGPHKRGDCKWPL